MKNQLQKTSILCIFFLLVYSQINAQNITNAKANPNHFRFLIYAFKDDIEGCMSKVFKQALFQVGLKEELTQFSFAIYPKRGESKPPITIIGNKLNAYCIAYLKNVKVGDKIIINQIKK